MNEPNLNDSARDDELLSAMLDGELPESEADALTKRLAREPALAKRLEALRGADESVRELFAKVDELPLPQAVLDLVESSDASHSATDTNVIAFPRRIIQRFAQAPVAIAASIALVAGFLADRLLTGSPGEPLAVAALQAHIVPDDSAMHALLESTASAASVTFADGSQGQVILTFEDQRGDWCRQLAVANTASSVQALACRRNGKWQNEVMAFGAPAGGTYQQASAGSAALLDSAIDRMIGERDPLAGDEEIELIRNQWQKKP